jgi:outer membrane protein
MMIPLRFHPSTVFALAAVAVAVAGAAPARAQQPEGEPLSLQQALGTARENNPQYRRALTEVGTADADVRRARGAFLPSVSLGLSSSAAYTRAFTGTGQFGEPVVQDEAVESMNSGASQSVGLSQYTLLDGGQRNRDLRAARAGAQVVEARVGAQAVVLQGEVTRRYWLAVRADRAIVLEEALLVSARDRLELVRGLMRVGVRNPLDVLGAEITVAEQEQALEKARGDARKAQLDLRESMGVLQGPRLRLTDEPVAPFDPAGLDAEALVGRALAAHPRVSRADFAVAQSEQRLGSAHAARWPRLSMGANLGRGQRYQNFGGLVSLNPLDQSAGVTFNLSIPLFTGFQSSYQVQAARAGRDAALEDARGERLALEREVRGALVDLDAAYRAAVNAERTATLNRQRLQLAQQQYRVGALTQSDLTDAVERAARAERDVLRTRYDFATALATLEERLGGPVRS